MTALLLVLFFSAIYIGWEAWIEFAGKFHNGTNVDDDAARVKWFVISAACVTAIGFSEIALLEMWSRSPNERRVK